jgi:hypothetical protein
MPAPLVFVDTETTSLRHGRRAWEVALIRVEPGQSTGRGTSFFVGDVDLSHADPKSLHVGRFYDRHPLYAPGSEHAPGSSSWVRGGMDIDRPADLVTDSQAARIVEHWTRGAHVVGAVPSFDAEVFDDLLHRHHLAPAWHYHLIDVEAMMLGFLHGRFGDRHTPQIRGLVPAVTVDERTYDDAGPVDQIATRWQVDLPWSSEDLASAIGVPPGSAAERHTAMGDARWAQRIYNRITTGRVVP